MQYSLLLPKATTTHYNSMGITAIQQQQISLYSQRRKYWISNFSLTIMYT